MIDTCIIITRNGRNGSAGSAGSAGGTVRSSSGLSTTSSAGVFPKDVEVDSISKALAIIFRRNVASRSIQDNRTALHLALRSGNTKLVFSLLDKNRTSTTDIREAAQNSRQQQTKKVDKTQSLGKSIFHHTLRQHFLGFIFVLFHLLNVSVNFDV